MSLGNEGFISLSKITETQASLGGYFLGKNRLSEEQQKQSRAVVQCPWTSIVVVLLRSWAEG